MLMHIIQSSLIKYSQNESNFMGHTDPHNHCCDSIYNSEMFYLKKKYDGMGWDGWIYNKGRCCVY